jgi:hypothetical protein
VGSVQSYRAYSGVVWSECLFCSFSRVFLEVFGLIQNSVKAQRLISESCAENGVSVRGGRVGFPV